MKLQEALNIIETKENGYMIHFEKREGGILSSDYFPDKHDGEELISTLDEAWELAEKFAKGTDEFYVNIYVVDHNFYPVEAYERSILKRY